MPKPSRSLPAPDSSASPTRSATVAVQAALDAYETAGHAAGVHHRIEHIELVQERDVPRFAELGVVASMQPLHMAAARADGSDEWAARVGPERTAAAFRAQTLRSSGAILALGSDWMVAPFDPRLGMAWARLRRTPGRLEMPPRAGDQALTALQTLEGYTTGAAVGHLRRRRVRAHQARLSRRSHRVRRRSGRD